MFTSVDKALVALIGALLWLIDLQFGDDWFGHIGETDIAVVVAILMPILVWLIPNRGH